jgi:zinc D-Ala-D-Ala carboxypeptidase
MNFSPNFSLYDLTLTNIPHANVPNIIELDRLQALVEHILQPIADNYKKPFRIISGYRSAAVNKTLGGSQESQHRKGEAVDITSENNQELFQFIRDHLEFDQLIWKGGSALQPAYIHISYSKKINRKQVLRMTIVNGEKHFEIMP